jgi:CBS domain-containing protein
VAASGEVGPRDREDYLAALVRLAAFHFIQVLRLRTQLEHDRSGQAPSNRLDPYALNPLERRFFRESLRQAEVVQKRMDAAFGSEAPRI